MLTVLFATLSKKPRDKKPGRSVGSNFALSVSLGFSLFFSNDPLVTLSLDHGAGTLVRLFLIVRDTITPSILPNRLFTSGTSSSQTQSLIILRKVSSYLHCE